MFERNLNYFFIILSSILVGYYIYHSINEYLIEGTFLYNNITMIFVCAGLCLLFLSFHIHRKVKRNKTYNPDKDKLAKLFSLFIFWICLICLINYFALIIENGFSEGEILFWQMASMILGMILISLYIYLFNKKKTYYL